MQANNQNVYDLKQRATPVPSGAAGATEPVPDTRGAMGLCAFLTSALYRRGGIGPDPRMYGMFLRALQGYVACTFGDSEWSRVLTRAGIRAKGFEPLVAYDAELFRRVLTTTGKVLARPAEAVLEDLGTFIVANPRQPAPRRLLRFGGATFAEFLLSLEELPDRARLALPDLDFPRLSLTERGGGRFRLTCWTELPELAHVLVGVLRAMADDYGALVVIEPGPPAKGRAVLVICLLEARFAEGRRFALTQAG